MRSLQYKMPEGNPTLFSSLLVYENTLICGVCHQEKSRFLFHQRVNRIGVNCQYRDHGPLCKECASKGKHCSACGIYKVFVEFPKAKCGANRGGVAAYCFLCKRKRSKREYTPEAGRARNMRAHHGITIEQYQAMLEAQNGVCAVCGQSETTRGKNGKVLPLAIDHNHTTGQIRALLCLRCNTFLGKIETNMEFVQKLFRYLDTYQ